MLGDFIRRAARITWRTSSRVQGYLGRLDRLCSRTIHWSELRLPGAPKEK